MTSTGPPEIFDQKGNSDSVINKGFIPLLYTVADGTYGSNSSYGAGAAEINNYNDEQLTRGVTTIPLIGGAGPPFYVSTEGCEIRQKDDKTNFSVNICLNGTTDPDFGDEELRIKPKPIVPGQPPRYIIPFPLPIKELPDPTFVSVEIVNKSGVQIAPDEAPSEEAFVLGARILTDGTMALTKHNLADVGNEVPLRHSDITDGFVDDNVIIIKVRGRYTSQVSYRK